MTKDKELALYEQEMGKAKAERQAELAKSTCKRCGGRDGRHHPACKWRP